MASSSRIPADPVRLTEVRHDQRRVAALLGASGQLNVSFLPHASIPVQDLYKSRFYRQLQATRSSLPTRVPPLGHPLVRLPGWKQTDKDNPLVSNQYGHVASGGDEQIGGTTRSPPHQLPVGATDSYSRRQAVALARTLSKSVPSSLGLDRSNKSSNRDAKSLSRYESLPDIGVPQRSDDIERSKVEFRLPRRRHREPGIDLITEGKTAPPHLQYNHGIVHPGRPDPPSISQTFSPIGWLREDTDQSDVGPVPNRNKTHHRKRKHQSLTTPLMRTHEHDEVPFNSPESSTVSMDKPSSSDSDTSSLDTIGIADGTPCPDGNGRSINKLGVDEHKNVTSPSNDDDDRSASGPSDLNMHPPAPKGSLGSGGVNPNDDPYGTAYLKALSVARSKAVKQDPFYLSQRMTRPFTFSYFCQKEVCACGNCPKMKRKKGKTGLKSILGDVNMYDYFKWSKDKKEKS